MNNINKFIFLALAAAATVPALAATSSCPTATSAGSIPGPGPGNDLATMNATGSGGGCWGTDITFSGFAVTGPTLGGTYIYASGVTNPGDALTFATIRGLANGADLSNDDGVNQFRSNSASTTAEFGYVVTAGSGNNPSGTIYTTMTLSLNNYVTNAGNNSGIDYTVKLCLGGTQSTLLGTGTSCAGGGVYQTFSIPHIGSGLTGTSVYTIALSQATTRVWVDNFMDLNGTGQGQTGTLIASVTNSFEAPEPSTIGLFAAGLVAMSAAIARRKKSVAER